MMIKSKGNIKLKTKKIMVKLMNLIYYSFQMTSNLTLSNK